MSVQLYQSMVSKHQHVEELYEFCERIVRQRGVRSYLEIGCKYGCSLFAVSRYMPVSSRFVAVEKERATREWPQSHPSLVSCIDRLKSEGHTATLIWGDSTDPDTVHQVAKHAPFDLVFIDANHSLPFVTKDWENYGPLARMVAFHDISWKRNTPNTAIAVPTLWNKLKGSFDHDEIKLDPKGKDNGIGVIFMDASSGQ